jgi:hypothetical protein
MTADKISRSMIEDMFQGARRDRRSGRANWDIDDVCRWSFFFVDGDRDKLIRAGLALEPAGYELVGLLEPSDGEEDQETIYVRLDRVEKHTVDSLLSRNDELYAFAERFGLTSYDGMDVGAVDGP